MKIENMPQKIDGDWTDLVWFLSIMLGGATIITVLIIWYLGPDNDLTWKGHVDTGISIHDSNNKQRQESQNISILSTITGGFLKIFLFGVYLHNLYLVTTLNHQM